MTAPAAAPPAHRDPRPAATRRRGGLALALGLVLLAALAITSLFVGTASLSLPSILDGLDARETQTLLESRIPRTLALLLSGSAMAVAGIVMQLLVRNRFVEPTTAGTTESATLGLLLATVISPAMPLPGKMLLAVIAGLAGTWLFLRILGNIPLRSQVVAPVVGLVLSGVVGSVSTFIAYRTDLMHTLSAWMTGDFSGVVSGRYELLWIVAATGIVAYLAANRFTVAGLGEEFSTNLGVNHRRVMALGLTVVAVTAAVVVVVVGALPFLGLVVPNLVSAVMGDYLRRSLPWVALVGAGFVLMADLIGRTIIAPAEIPVGVVAGVLGAAIFLVVLVRRFRDA